MLMDIIIILYIFVTILQSIAIALGVGSSTLAISNFFVAIADGRITEDERKMMGVVYIVLRVAMLVILITTTIITLSQFALYGGIVVPFMSAVWTLIAVLFVNAVLMTYHKIPTTIGPALQASSWYTLGILMALTELDIYPSSYLVFLLSYLSVVLFAVSLVNGIMALLKRRKQATH